jgi:putative ABC transport system permease protein
VSHFRLLLLWRAMFLRRRRLSIALAALIVGAMLASALLTTYADLDRKMAGEFRRYGANLVIAPPSGVDSLPADVLDRAEQQGVVAVPYFYVVGRVKDRDTVLGGVDLTRLRRNPPSWKLNGAWPRASAVGRPGAPVECLSGERLGLHPGERVQVSVGAGPQISSEEWLVTGAVSTGASEDSQLLASIDDVRGLAKIPGRLSLIEVTAPPRQVDQTRDRLAAALPDADVRVLRAVAESTAQILLRVRGLLYAASLVILSIVTLSVATTLYAIVLDRKRDIGVMKALGAGEANIAGLLVTESAVLGLGGGIIGCTLGLAAAAWIGQAIYQSAVSVRWLVVPEVLFLTVTVAVLATLFPLRVAREVSAAAELKGE